MGMHKHGKGSDPYLPTCVQGGKRKVTFRTKADAKRRARAGRFNHQYGPLRAYHCRECGYFHLSSQPRT